MDDFKNRAGQLDYLINRWDNLHGPDAVIITGFSGIGKTHFVDQYYKHISKNNAYWKSLQNNSTAYHKVIDHSPDFNNTTDHVNLEWLWLATRCYESGQINGSVDSVIFFEKIRFQFTFHLLSIIKSIKHKAVNKKLAKSAITALTHLALPGSGLITEIYNFVKEIYSDSNDFVELVKSISEKNSTNKLADDFYKREVKGLLEETVSLFSEIYKVDQAFKIVIHFDDAQWLDDYSLQIIQELFQKAKDKGWNILFLFSGWDQSAFQHADSVSNTSYNNLFSWIRSVSENPSVLHLKQLSRTEIMDIVRQRLPNVQTEVAHFLVDRCHADIDLLNDYIDEIAISPFWLDGSGKLTVPIEQLANLPSKAVDMARKRLNTLPPSTRDTLLWSSVQGITFYEKLIEELLIVREQTFNYEESLTDSDKNYGIIELKKHLILKNSGEFRRAVFYEACSSIFSRHPELKNIRYALLDICYRFIISEEWQPLENDKRNQITHLYNELTNHFKPKDKKYQLVRISILIDFAKNRLMTGDFNATINILENLYTGKLLNEQKASINEVLAQAYYVSGSLKKEYGIFKRWEKLEVKPGFSFLILYAKYLRRVSKPLKALEYDHKAVEVAASQKQTIEAKLEVAKTLWTAGSVENAKTTLVSLEHDFTLFELSELGQDINYHHTCCLVLHDLEQNKEVAHHARACVKGYELNGDIQLQIISGVNLGDAMFGLGYEKEAKKILLDACQMAADYQLPHTQDIAYICYANVLTDLNLVDDAKHYYQLGLDLATAIGHDWDTIYGQVYYGVFLLNGNDQLPVNHFTALYQQSVKAGYLYLADLSAAGQCIFDYYSGTIIAEYASRAFNPVITLPGCKIYEKAAFILAGHHNDIIISEFIRLLGEIQGTKLSKDFIFKAINKLLANGLVKDKVDQYFLTRWKNLYTKKIERNQEIKLTTCDYKLCEAMCCYDGVYLSLEDEQKIKEAIAIDPEFFSHLPQDYIVTSDWKNISGKKTNTRPHNYRSADFPGHFNKTRCVFAFEDGACSLQAFSTKHTDDPWKYKPEACKLHPLQVSGADFFAPPANKEDDKYALGINYPGYVSYTPCGQNRHDGHVWVNELGGEITEFLKSFDDSEIELGE